jgi:hypothetical protein
VHPSFLRRGGAAARAGHHDGDTPEDSITCFGRVQLTKYVAVTAASWLMLRSRPGHAEARLLTFAVDVSVSARHGSFLWTGRVVHSDDPPHRAAAAVSDDVASVK